MLECTAQQVILTAEYIQLVVIIIAGIVYFAVSSSSRTAGVIAFCFAACCYSIIKVVPIHGKIVIVSYGFWYGMISHIWVCQYEITWEFGVFGRKKCALEI